MKARKGFVSNSSTTSFLVIFKKDVKRKNDLDFTPTELFDFIDSYFLNHSDDNDVEIGKERVYEKRFEWTQDDKEITKFNKMIEKIREDEDIAHIKLNMHIPIIQDLIKHNRYIKILESYSD